MRCRLIFFGGYSESALIFLEKIHRLRTAEHGVTLGKRCMIYYALKVELGEFEV